MLTTTPEGEESAREGKELRQHLGYFDNREIRDGQILEAAWRSVVFQRGRNWEDNFCNG